MGTARFDGSLSPSGALQLRAGLRDWPLLGSLNLTIPGTWTHGFGQELEGFLHFVTAVSQSETKRKIGRYSGRNDYRFG
jgi:hypothetical protein